MGISLSTRHRAFPAGSFEVGVTTFKIRNEAGSKISGTVGRGRRGGIAGTEKRNNKIK